MMRKSSYRFRAAAASVAAVLMLGMVMGGCAMGNSRESEEKNSAGVTDASAVSEQTFSWYEGMPLTSEMEEMAVKLDCDDGVIEQMRESGVTRDAYYNIAPALAIEKHMTEKYGISFEVTTAWIDSVDDTNRVFAYVTPTTGEHEGKEYLARCDWKTSQEPSFFEEYFADYWQTDYQTWWEKELAGEVSACNTAPVISARLTTQVLQGDEIAPSVSITDIVSACGGCIGIYFPESVTEDEYTQDADALLAVLSAKGVALEVTFACVYNLDHVGGELTAEIGDDAVKNEHIDSVAKDLLPCVKWKRIEYSNWEQIWH